MSADEDDERPGPDAPSAPKVAKQRTRRKAKPRELTSVARAPSPEPRIRTTLIASASASLVGIALVGTGPSLLGMVLVVAGVVGLVLSIHRFGRLGPEGS